MFKLFIPFVLLFLLPAGLAAQIPDTLETTAPVRCDILEELGLPAPNGGEVRLHAEASVENLLKWHTGINERKKSFTGFRIQIYSVNSYGCDMEKLKKTRQDFEEALVDIPAYLKYFDPDFKIRAGNFHSRLESIPALHRIRRFYPSSYPVRTEITLDELKRVPLQELLEEEKSLEGTIEEETVEEE